MASILPLINEVEHEDGIDDIDKPDEVTVVDPPPLTASTDGAFGVVTDLTLSLPSTDEPLEAVTVTDLSSSPATTDESKEPDDYSLQSPASTDEAFEAVFDTLSPASIDEAFEAVFDTSSPATNDKTLTAVLDALSSPASTDAVLEAITDPPLSLLATGDALEAVTGFTSSPASTDEALEAITDPPLSLPATVEALEAVAGSISSPASTNDALEAITDPPLSIPVTVKALEAVTDSTSSPASTDGALEAITDPQLSLPATGEAVQQEENVGFSLNLEVLENLFSVCPAKDLAKFRYVSKDWNKAAIKSWRQAAQVTIVNHHEGKQRRKYFEKLLPLDNLIQHMNDPEDPRKLNFECYHFHKYKLEYWYLTNRNPNMVIFWGNLGPSITQLHLYDLRIDNMDTMLEILYEKVPNMKTLILDRLCVLKNGVSTQAERYSALPAHEKLSILKVRQLSVFKFPVNWHEFLGHFPKIKRLESFSINNDATLTSMLQAVNDIRMVRDILKLKSLTIVRADKRHRCVQQRISEQLKDLLFALRDVQLEEFKLKLGCKTTVADAKVLLGSFTESIRKLTFHVDFKSRNQHHRFPYLINFPVLEELQLFQWSTPEVSLHHVFKEMPNLRSLKVDGARKLFGDATNFYEKAVLGEKKPKVAVCTSLDELSLKSAVCRSRLTMIKAYYLVKFAPNLTKLELKMDDRIFRLVCKSYPNLIEMRVGGLDLTDAGVCGTSTFARGPEEKNENITKLKKLRVFVMNSLTHNLTDVSIFNGFLMLPKLFTLQMSLPEEQVSHEAREALEKGISNLVIMGFPKGKKREQEETTETSSLQASDDGDDGGDDDLEEGDE